MKRKEAKDKFYGQDDVDIFEGGPAGQTLKDIDPNYGGIQLEEDELIGNQFSRDLARFTKGVTEFISPSPETIAKQEEQRAKNQQIFDFILDAAGLEPGSPEAEKILFDLKRDKKFKENMGVTGGNILTGGGTTDSPEYGFFVIWNFFFTF